ncbi:MAG: hypothetical protein NZ555_12990 [Geminicoccaceae bacterium]|nr:hypothetical protein [Geminicoccaceae bacterium]MCX8102107.1 hypothetical protein [Geminicoccaceae bacterium]MDW8369404.1 FtsX-like permease family protein [Geminicoccaceae bacterium]
MASEALDLPLDDTPASRFLAWFIGGLTYLAVLACAVAVLAQGTVERLADTPRIVTVALPPVDDAAAGEAEVRAVRALLEGLPGVAYTSLVSKEELDRLVEPWLGRAGEDRPGEMPLPRLVDVRLLPGPEPDLAALAEKVRTVAPQALLEDTSPSHGTLETLARRLRWMGGGAGLVVLVLTLVVVVVVTRMSLDLHDETVDLLRLLGAPDRYVARQFELHAMASALKGGSIGFTAALATLVALLYLPPLLGHPLFAVEPRPLDWILLAIVPVLAALMITVAARLTATIGLARLR